MLKFKQISALGASALMVGLTMGVGAAANFPTPFSNNNADGMAIVSGSSSGVSDTVAVNDIASYLATKVQSVGGSSSATGGESWKLEKSTNKFNLGDSMNTFFSKLDSDELPNILGDGLYSNDDNDEFDFEQEITLAGLTLTHFLESDNDFSLADTPVIGFNLARNTFILNYTLEFTPDAAEAGGSWVAGNSLETTDLTMLGTEYYVLSARNSSEFNHKLTLLDAANSAIVTQSGTTTISAGGISYEVGIDWMSSTETILNINGVTTNKLKEGGVFKVSNDVYVAVKNNLFTDAQTPDLNKIEFSIGSGKIEIQNGVEVKINNEDVSNIVGSTAVLNGYISVTGNNLDKIVLEWKLDEDDWLIPGEDLTLPGLGTIKLSMGGFNIPSEELTTVDGDANSIKVSTIIKDGSLDLHILALNSTSSGFENLGEKPVSDSGRHILVTNDSTNSITIELNESQESYFVATWINGDDSESYAFEIQKIDGTDSTKNATTLNNLASLTGDIIIKSIGDSSDRGELTVTLDAADDALGTATITLTRTSGTTGTLYADRIVTRDGLTFRLPVDNVSATTDGYINITDVPTTWVMNFTEEDADGNIGSGKSFTVTLGVSGTDGGEVTTVSGITTYETTTTSNMYLGYVVSDLSTKVLHDRPTGSSLNSVEIVYHDTETFADVFVSESSVSIGGVDGGAGVPIFKDNEELSWKDRNVVLVGGSCINSATAKVLGVAVGTCGSDFTTATNVGVGEYMIKSVGGFFTTGKIALIVAGYSKADTQAAASYLTAHPNVDPIIDTESGKEFRGKTGATGSIVVSEV